MFNAKKPNFTFNEWRNWAFSFKSMSEARLLNKHDIKLP